ncbi:alpha/beta hydrolase [Actinoplanes sp. NPDC049596]|uniref:alpha/beta fold hydrolase n=1 Tax=unclassified Actinoplanes TaxID=2626549 RepID=UPI0034322231
MVFEWSTVGAVQVNGVRLGYREAGDPAGPPVVLVHGTGSSASTWDRFAARLVPLGHRVIAFDLRGHATSPAAADYRLTSLRDDLLGVMRALAVRGATVIGHSVGAYAAVGVALHSPELISHLVLEDVAAPPRWVGLPRRLCGLATRRPVPAILLQLFCSDAGWWSRLPEVRQPALVLSGGPASCIPPGRLAAVTAALPDARLATIPVGHRVHSLAPDAFFDEVASFLRPTQPVSAPVV